MLTSRGLQHLSAARLQQLLALEAGVDVCNVLLPARPGEVGFADAVHLQMSSCPSLEQWCRICSSSTKDGLRVQATTAAVALQVSILAEQRTLGFHDPWDFGRFKHRELLTVLEELFCSWEADPSLPVIAVPDWLRTLRVFRENTQTQWPDLTHASDRAHEQKLFGCARKVADAILACWAGRGVSDWRALAGVSSGTVPCCIGEDLRKDLECCLLDSVSRTPAVPVPLSGGGRRAAKPKAAPAAKPKARPAAAPVQRRGARVKPSDYVSCNEAPESCVAPAPASPQPERLRQRTAPVDVAVSDAEVRAVMAHIVSSDLSTGVRDFSAFLRLVASRLGMSYEKLQERRRDFYALYVEASKDDEAQSFSIEAGGECVVDNAELRRRLRVFFSTCASKVVACIRLSTPVMRVLAWQLRLSFGARRSQSYPT